MNTFYVYNEQIYYEHFLSMNIKKNDQYICIGSQGVKVFGWLLNVDNNLK